MNLAKVPPFILFWDNMIIWKQNMSEESLNVTSLLSRLAENEEFTRDIITNLDSFFLTINGSLIILMQVNPFKMKIMYIKVNPSYS